MRMTRRDVAAALRATLTSPIIRRRATLIQKVEDYTGFRRHVMASKERDSPTPTFGRETTDLGDLVPVVYRELRRIAHHRLAHHGDGSTLSTTALVHEVYLKLVNSADAKWNNRAHFLALASVAMRQILVDRAKARSAIKRGGMRRRVTLDDDAIAADGQPEAFLQIDEALNRLAAVDARLARVVELRFFGGVTHEEIAAHFGLTVRTIERDWAKARVLLRGFLAT
jgi:RNA polymerase sigma factor (TIGR02999 family)